MGVSKILTIAALAAGALAIDIPTEPVWPSGRCTDKSLSIPSWILSQYTVSEDGTTSFLVTNRAEVPSGINAIYECTPDGKCSGSSGTSGMSATFSQTAEGTVITLSDIWVCDDEGDNVFFSASGSTTIPPGVKGLSPISYLMHGSLSLPVPLTPAQPSPPAGYEAESCASVGDNQWTVTDVSYKNYAKGQCLQWYYEDRICLDPTGDFTPRGVQLHLTVTNNAIDHNVVCDFTPSYDIHDLPSPLRCTGGEFNEITLDVTLTGTAPLFELKIEQLWYCLENPTENAKPSVIVATGSIPFELDCTSSTGITGTEDDIITICTDPAASHSVDGTQSAKETLSEFSLVTAYPVHGGCTFDSVVNPTWFLRGMFFETNEFPANDPDSVTLDRFTCGLTGPGFADYFFYVGEVISGSGIDSVYSCRNIHNGQPVHWDCSYSFDPFQKILTLDKTWQCNDKNESGVLYFSGSGSFDWKIDPTYMCNDSDTSVRCSWYSDLATLQPGIPYDIPHITTSLTNGATSNIATVRANNKWVAA